MRCLVIQIETQVAFLIIFGAHVNILSIIKVKTLVLIKCSYTPPPQLCPLLNLEWLSYYEHTIQSILNTCFFGLWFWESHQTTYHPNIGGRKM